MVYTVIMVRDRPEPDYKRKQVSHDNRGHTRGSASWAGCDKGSTHEYMANVLERIAG